MKDPRSRYKIVNDLFLFQKIKKVKVILVFDGPPDEDLENKLSSYPGFNLRFPELHQNADAIIKEIISSWQNKRQFFVVSSDREIKSFTRMHGLKIITCEDFNRQLKRMAKKHKKFQEMQKEDSFLSPLEVKQWQEVFDSKQNE